VTVERRVESQSASGEVTWTWEAHPDIGEAGRVWASVIPNSGSKFMAANQLQVDVSHTVRVRRQAGYRTDQRIAHDVEPGVTEYLAIEAVIPVNDDRQKIDLMCKLRESTGFR